MKLRRNCTVLLMVFLCQTIHASGAEPELKSAVKLSLGSRFLRWAAPEIVDWNGDGLNDVVVGYHSGGLAVYLNRGMGAKGIIFEKDVIQRRDTFGRSGTPFWAWRYNKANCICPGPGRISPRVVDWDNDGKKDLVIGDGTGAQTRVWLNIGTDAAPVFSTHHIQYLPPDAGIRPYHETVQPCIADWNGDGNKDLIMGRNRGIYIYQNKGTDNAPRFDFDRSRLGAKIRTVFPSMRLNPVFVDWDGDGKKDLLVGSQGGEVWFARNVGTTNRPEFKGYTPARAGGNNIRVDSEARLAVADLDGDGRDDLLVGAGNGEVSFFQARNAAPVARSRSVRVKRGKSAAILLVGTDDAKRKLKYQVLTQPTHGTLEGTAPNLKYTPRKDYQGQDRFQFKVAVGEQTSKPATVLIEIQPADQPPTIATQPADVLVGIGQPATLRVGAAGTPPFTYQWSRNGKPIPQATGASYVIRKTTAEDSAKYAVTVKNSAGAAKSRAVDLQVKPLPGPKDKVPVIAIAVKSPVIEPSTPGVITITRTRSIKQAVTVKLASRRGHNPVIADIHYVPLPSSITLKAGQKSAEVKVMPIDDTLVNGTQHLTFLIVPNPAYRLATRTGATRMTFLDDDCPDVGISSEKHTFTVTAQPAPRRDTEITYTIGGTAVGGVDYEALPGTVTIPAGKSSATIVVKPYKQAKSAGKKTVALTLPQHRFTFFDFYHYLTPGNTRSASVVVAPTAASPARPSNAKPPDAAVEKLRKEVFRLGWIVFSGRSGGPTSDLDLYLMRPDGSHLRNITNTPKLDEHSARFSPGGKKLLYRRANKSATIHSSDQTQQNVAAKAISSWPAAGTLVIANADGTAPRSCGSDGEYAWATWGPKGMQIACLEQVELKAPDPKRKPKPSYKIVIREADTLKVIKEMRARGIEKQAIWSPDGKRFCGPANVPPGKMRYGKGKEYPLGTGKMVSFEIATGRRTSMAQFPDWYPVWASDTDGDWFQGGAPWILHSANNYGICPAYYAMLWRSGLDRQPSRLVFGEYQKNVWGGCTSPDDRYAIFVIGGKKWPLQGKMAIIRLADAPIARGASPLFHEVLADYFPKLKKGPILDLIRVPEGFDPHWTGAEIVQQ